MSDFIAELDISGPGHINNCLYELFEEDRNYNILLHVGHLG